MQYFYQSVPLFKTIFYATMIYKLGFVIGILLDCLIYFGYDMLMLYLFKLTNFTVGDLKFMWTENEEASNGLGVMTFDKMDLEGLKQLFIERGLKNFKRLHSKAVYKFFDFWWQEMSIEEGIKRIKQFNIKKGETENSYNSEKLPESLKNKVIKTKEDLVNFSNQELMVKFDLKNEVPFTLFLIKNENNAEKYQNLFIFKFDHVLTDGIGIIALLTSLADNYSLDLFPKPKKAFNSKENILEYIFNNLIIVLGFPYYVIYPFLRNLFICNSGDTLFKSKSKQKGYSSASLSKSMNLADFTKISRKLNITLNDLIMSIFSSGIKNYVKSKGFNKLKFISTMTPIGKFKTIKSIKDLNLANNTSGVACKLALINKPLEEYHLIHNEYKQVRNVPIVTACKICLDSLYTFMPFYLAEYIIKSCSRNFDITFSNVPGPKEHLFYGGCKMNQMIPFITTGLTKAFVAIISYHGEIRINITFDNVLGLDASEFKAFINTEIENLKKEFKLKYETYPEANNKKFN